MDPITAIVGGVMVIQWAYHRWFEDKDPPAPQDEIQIPLTAAGTPYPLIYGRCRVRKPILAWAGPMFALNADDASDLDRDTYWQGSQYLYTSSFFFIIGIGFYQGAALAPISRIFSIYAGDERVPDGPYALLPPKPGAQYVRLSSLIGDGDNESSYTTGPRPCFVWGHYDLAVAKGSDWEIGGLIEFYNGSEQQVLVDPGTLVPNTAAGSRMDEIGDASLIPGYRGFISLFLGSEVGTPGSGTPGFGLWGLGSSGRMPDYSFEVASYATQYFDSSVVGDEANPIDVIYDLLTSPRGKLGISTSLIDNDSFRAAAIRCASEGLGYSRALESGTAADAIMGILRHIDATLYPNPQLGMKICVKLVRADFVVADLLHITPENASKVEFAGARGWTGVINRLNLVFSNRARDYQDDTITADNLGNAIGQSGEIAEATVQMPGCCTAAQATILAARELSARSRPLMKLRVTCSKEFGRLNPGDAVAMTWPEYHISGLVFRVAAPARGGRDENSVELDVIQDFGYTHRFETTGTGGLPHHPPPVG